MRRVNSIAGLDRLVIDVAAGRVRRPLFVGSPAVAVRFARRVRDALDPPCDRSQLELAWLYAGAGIGEPPPVPFRAPHYTCSTAALTGTRARGQWRPGEISLASHGVLFFDEVHAVRRSVLDVAATALDVGRIRDGAAAFPARPRVVMAAATTCPCAHAVCLCDASWRERHRARVEHAAEVLGATLVESELRTGDIIARRH